MNHRAQSHPAESAASWSLAEVATLAEGEVIASDSARAGRERFAYGDLSTDSRSLRSGDFFVALRGENHDGHDHVAAAAAAGASGLFVDRPILPSCPQVRVRETLLGWQTWAANHRQGWGDSPLIGVTGSSGKTTVKDLVAHLLRGLGPVWSTAGNRNNHFGVPWTLLGLSSEHEYAVVEMGMNHAGEIEHLSKLARPDLGVITSIGRAHLGPMGSREAILEAKLEIVRGLPAGAPLVLPADPWVATRLPKWIDQYRLIRFGFEDDADWRPQGEVEYSIRGSCFQTEQGQSVELSLLGEGAVLSCLAALAVVDALGADLSGLVSRLKTASRQPLRMEPRWIAGALWLLDCYNASPESCHLAIEFLKSVPFSGRRVLVLGELSELGEHSADVHAELVQAAAGLDYVHFIGPAFEPVFKSISGVGHVEWSAMREEASIRLCEGIAEGDLVLLKASRRMALERILERLTPGHRSRGEAAS